MRKSDFTRFASLSETSEQSHAITRTHIASQCSLARWKYSISITTLVASKVSSMRLGDDQSGRLSDFRANTCSLLRNSRKNLKSLTRNSQRSHTQQPSLVTSSLKCRGGMKTSWWFMGSHQQREQTQLHRLLLRLHTPSWIDSMAHYSNWISRAVSIMPRHKRRWLRLQLAGICSHWSSCIDTMSWLEARY